jgi:hypothetical protein
MIVSLRKATEERKKLKTNFLTKFVNKHFLESYVKPFANNSEIKKILKNFGKKSKNPVEERRLPIPLAAAAPSVELAEAVAAPSLDIAVASQELLARDPSSSRWSGAVHEGSGGARPCRSGAARARTHRARRTAWEQLSGT